jgi:hypothetical protein
VPSRPPSTVPAPMVTPTSITESTSTLRGTGKPPGPQSRASLHKTVAETLLKTSPTQLQAKSREDYINEARDYHPILLLISTLVTTDDLPPFISLLHFNQNQHSTNNRTIKMKFAVVIMILAVVAAFFGRLVGARFDGLPHCAVSLE